MSPDVEPANPPEPAPPEQGGDTKLPDNLIHIPAIQALIAGTPPAISARIKEFEKNPAAKLIAENKGLLQQAGMGFYRSLSGDIGVLFNSFHIHPQDLQAADKAGKLGLIAPPFDSVNHAVSKSGLNNPVLKPISQPGAPKAPSLQAPPQFANQPPAAQPPLPAPKPIAATLQRQLMAQRGKVIQEGPPATGPAPGAGRLLNSIMKPVV
jgi:hypothetical protein